MSDRKQAHYLPRGLVILGWSSGPAAAYALLGLLHAALVERMINVDIGFGRSLAFWVLTLYIALPLWGFLPSSPRRWYARRRTVQAALLLGILGTLVCGGFTVAWLAAHWSWRAGPPVVASLVVVGIAAAVTLRFASREEEVPPR
jgi:hypothetical protein